MDPSDLEQDFFDESRFPIPMALPLSQLSPIHSGSPTLINDLFILQERVSHCLGAASGGVLQRVQAVLRGGGHQPWREDSGGQVLRI